MKTEIRAILPAISQSYQECEVFIERLIEEIDTWTQDKKNLESTDRYTKQIKQQIAKKNASIQDNKNKIEEVQQMMTFSLNAMVVRQGEKTPGKIVELKIANRVPEVHVLWEGNLVQVPERPNKLKLITSSDLEYFWYGSENAPRLCRKLDLTECDRLYKLLAFFLNCDGEMPRHKAYLKKRFNYIANKNFVPNSRVSLGDRTGEVLDYKAWKKDDDGLTLVAIQLDRGNKIFKNPAGINLVNSASSSEADYSYESSKNKKLNNLLDFCSRKPNIETIAISDIKRDGGTQQRVDLNHETVAEYAEAMQRGDKFPPIKLVYDGSNYWLTDGFHTTEAAYSIGRTEILAEISEGSQRDAILISVGVNAAHGLRRSNADKRRAVTTLLKDEEWGKWSDNIIAKKCKVSQPFVSKLRKELLTYNVISEKRVYQDKHGNVSKMNTSNIGLPAIKANEEVLSNNTGERGSTFNPEDRAWQTSISELAAQFEIGQLVQLKLSNFHGASENLKLANHRYGQITALTENGCSLNVNILGHKSFVVSPQDLKPVEAVRFCVEFSPKQFIALMSMHKSRAGIEQAIIDGVLK